MGRRIGVGRVLPSTHRGARIAVGVAEVKGVAAMAGGGDFVVGQVDGIYIELLFGRCRRLCRQFR